MKQLLPVLCQLAIALLCLGSPVRCQQPASFDLAIGSGNDPFRLIGREATSCQRLLSRNNRAYLKVLAAQEKRLARKLADKDSAAASSLLAEIRSVNSRLCIDSSSSTDFLPKLDSVIMTLRFAQEALALAGVPDGVKASLRRLNSLQDQLNRARSLTVLAEARQRLLIDRLAKYGMGLEIRALQGQLQVYRSRVAGYRQFIADPSRLETASLRALQRLPAFRQFFQQHAQAAAFFPGEGEGPADSGRVVPGLQTRLAVSTLVKNRFGSATVIQSAGSSSAVGAGGFPAAQQVLNKGLNTIVDDQRLVSTRRWHQRIETGVNIQQVKANHFFPSTTDIGVSVGYPLNPRSVAGIGVSYKIGWGSDLKHLQVSHQGAGLRSFLDYKLKSGFWLTAAAEMNYRSEFRSFEVLRDYSQWQKSGLVGVSKKYAVNGKFSGNAQVLYDLLWKSQVPRTQPVVFRVGYSFRK